MKHISSKQIPNPAEQTYWVDLKENPYGGIIKYYDQDKDEWVYVEEPLFQKSPASSIRQEHIDTVEELKDVPQQINSINTQLIQLDESKVAYGEVYLKKESDDIHEESKQLISELDKQLSDTEQSLRNRVDEIESAVGLDMSSLTNALSTKASYVYVDERIKSLTGVAPDALDTLEELSKALGDDPNFAATIAEQLGSKLDKTQTIETINEEVPEWSRKEFKPVYTAKEVGAIPFGTTIPERTSQLTNDAGFLTSLEVNALIQQNKPLTAQQYAKINKLDAYTVYELTEGDLSIPTNYQTIVANTSSAVNNLNIGFESKPIAGSSYTLYVNPVIQTTIKFYTMSGELYHTVTVKDMMRFDITIIDLTNYQLVTENGSQLLTSNGHVIVCNIVDGYIIDYIRITSDDTLTWYEGE